MEAKEAVGLDKVFPIQGSNGGVTLREEEEALEGRGGADCPAIGRGLKTALGPGAQAGTQAWSLGTEAWRLNSGVWKQSGVGRHACTEANQGLAAIDQNHSSQCNVFP